MCFRVTPIKIGKKNSQIDYLKSDISTVDKLSKEANRRVQSDCTKQQAQDKADYQSRKEKLMAEITQLRKTLDTTVATNRESELQLRKVQIPGYPVFVLGGVLLQKAFKRETEVENWVQRYDSEMGEKQVCEIAKLQCYLCNYQDELEDVSTHYEQEQTQLKELEERFKVLEEEYNIIMEEKRIAKEKAEKLANEMQKAARAATVIQVRLTTLMRLKLL